MNQLITTTTFDEFCMSILPIPPNVIMFGVAEDGLPVLFDTSNERHKNVLVFENYSGQGLLLLKSVVEFVLKYKTGKPVDVVVLSNHEWNPINGVTQNGCECVSVAPFDSPIAEDVLEALAMWSGKPRKQVILFIDGIYNIESMSENARYCLNQIILHGFRRGVFTIASSGIGDVSKWLGFFDSEIACHEDYCFSFKERVEKEMVSTKFYVPVATI